MMPSRFAGFWSWLLRSARAGARIAWPSGELGSGVLTGSAEALGAASKPTINTRASIALRMTGDSTHSRECWLGATASLLKLGPAVARPHVRAPVRRSSHGRSRESCGAYPLAGGRESPRTRSPCDYLHDDVEVHQPGSEPASA